MPHAFRVSSAAIAALSLLVSGLACSAAVEDGLATVHADAAGHDASRAPSSLDGGTDGAGLPDDPSARWCRFETANWIPTDGSLSTNFSSFFETPAGIELLSLYRTRLLAFDQTTKQFVVYRTRMESSDSFEVAEDVRLNAGYDRAVLAEGALACRAGACDLIVWREDSGVPIAAAPVAVPNEVAATTTSANCVGGRGIVCLDGAAWTTAIGPELLPAPVAKFVRLHEDHFLVADTNGALYLVRSDVVVPFDAGTSEPFVDLSGVAYPFSDVWAARTSSGLLVRGDLSGGHACDLHVDGVEADSLPGLVLRRGERMIFTDIGSHPPDVFAIPPGTLAVGKNFCGVAMNPVAIDAHHVYAPPLQCYID